MGKAPDQGAALGALGLAGICRETLHVIRSFPAGFNFMCGMLITLSFSLLAHVAVSRALFSDAFASSSDAGGAGFVRLAANWAPFLVAEAAFLFIIIFHFLVSAAFCVISVAPGYNGIATEAVADRDARFVARDLREVPGFIAQYFLRVFRGDSRRAARLVRSGFAVFVRVAATSCVAFLLLLGYTALLAAVAVLMHLPRPALLLVGGAAYLAGATHIGAVWRVACVLSVMEDGARGSRAMHASDELLTAGGKFWAAATVFATLDGCAVAVQLAFGALVVDNRVGLSVLLRVAVGAVMAATLWATSVAVLVAQVVVYFVCKSYRRHCEGSVRAPAKSLTDVGRKGRDTRNRK
uniref:Uncharacterized protein n=1 Tax=Avena sativa TaxID=4498 RepID=A0ACD5Z7X3_AVESA